MRRAATIIGAIGLCCGPASAAAPQPLQPLHPLGAWNLDYGETQCAALRDFGTSQDAITFAIIPALNGETYELFVGRRHYGPMFAEELEGSVDFGSGPIKAWLLHYAGQGRKVELYQYRITAGEMAQARTAKRVRLRIEGGPERTFELEDMPALLDGLQKCTADLRQYWNVGGERDGRIVVPAKGDVRNVFTPNDYPSEALKRRQQGKAQYLLLVDDSGKVAGCHVQLASGVPALDAMGCVAIQERARFKPAQDKAGKAVRSAYLSPPVMWRL